MRLICAICAAAALSWNAGAAAAERRQAGNIVFDLPPGWEAAELLVGPDDLPLTVLRDEDWIDVDGPQINLARGAPTPSDERALLAWADARLTAYLGLDDDEAFESAAWLAPSTLGATQARIGGGMVRDREDGEVLRAVIAALIDAGGRAELVFVDVAARDAEDSQDGLEPSAEAMLSLAEGFSYVSLGAAPVVPSPRPGPLAGAFWGARLATTFQMNGTLGMDMQHSLYVFTPGGRFWDGIPPGGVSAFADPERRLVHTQDNGTYAVDGSEITLRYASGQTEVLEREDALTINDGGAVLGPVRLLPDGARLAARRDSLVYVPLVAGLGETASMTSSSSVNLRPDGRFGREGFTAATGSFESGGYHVGSDTGGLGTYAVRGGELMLTYADGRIVRWAAFVGGDGADETLWLGFEPAELPPGFSLPPGDAGRTIPVDETGTLASASPLATPSANPLAAPPARNPLAKPPAQNPLSR